MEKSTSPRKKGPLTHSQLLKNPSRIFDEQSSCDHTLCSMILDFPRGREAFAKAAKKAIKGGGILVQGPYMGSTKKENFTAKGENKYILEFLSIYDNTYELEAQCTANNSKSNQVALKKEVDKMVKFLRGRCVDGEVFKAALDYIAIKLSSAEMKKFQTLKKLHDRDTVVERLADAWAKLIVDAEDLDTV